METARRPSHTVCENYCEHEQGGCCSDTFYHYGALAGFIKLLEADNLAAGRGSGGGKATYGLLEPGGLKSGYAAR